MNLGMHVFTLRPLRQNNKLQTVPLVSEDQNYIIQVPSELEFFTLTCVLFVNIHRIYPGGPMRVPCTNICTDLL